MQLDRDWATKMPNPVEHRPDGTTAIEIRHKGTILHTIVLTGDYHRLELWRWRWRAWKDRTRPGVFYAQAHARVGGEKSSILLHRLITSAQTGEIVDHIAPNSTLLNVSENLRIVTQRVNALNKHQATRANRSTGALSVEIHHGGKFRVRIKVNGKSRNLGVYATISEAEDAGKRVRAQLIAGVPLERIPEYRPLPDNLWGRGVSFYARKRKWAAELRWRGTKHRFGQNHSTPQAASDARDCGLYWLLWQENPDAPTLPPAWDGDLNVEFDLSDVQAAIAATHMARNAAKGKDTGPHPPRL